jgi:hypothetical protein
LYLRDETTNKQNTIPMITTLAYTLKTEGISAMRSVLHALDRTALQAICMQNDRNGVWSDEDNLREYDCVMPDEAYREIIERWVTEDL